jgi:hypothetical protein
MIILSLFASRVNPEKQSATPAVANDNQTCGSISYRHYTTAGRHQKQRKFQGDSKTRIAWRLHLETMTATNKSPLCSALEG